MFASWLSYIRSHFRRLAASFHLAKGLLLLEQRDWIQAIASHDAAIRLDPKCAWAYYNRGYVWMKLGEWDKTIADYETALSLRPAYSYALNGLAWVSATCPDERFRDGGKALAFAEQASEVTHWKDPNPIGTLAAAYAEMGDFDTACAMMKRALATDPKDKNNELRETILDSFKAKKPWRDEPIE